MNKKAAMEMSVGTIVTIVLLMTVLILGLVLVRTIFKGATENIGAIDESIKSEISKLFSEDNSKKAIIYPPTREISIKKGESGGFGFSIRNTEQDTLASQVNLFTYVMSMGEVACQGITDTQALNYIILGKALTSGVKIPSGDALENPILVKFDIPESASLCKIRYNLDIEKNGVQYLPTLTIDLDIK